MLRRPLLLILVNAALVRDLDQAFPYWVGQHKFDWRKFSRKFTDASDSGLRQLVASLEKW